VCRMIFFHPLVTKVVGLFLSSRTGEHLCVCDVIRPISANSRVNV